MYMSENITRIVDLPDNITMQMPRDAPQFNGMTNLQEQNLSYSPMNIHPNPYGNSIDPNVIPLPQNPHMGQKQPNQQPPQYQQQQSPQYQQPPSQNYMSQEEQNALNNMPHVRLPSRDIPMDQTAYQQDLEITPNFIPKPKLTSDYIKQYEDINEEKLKKHEQNVKRTNELDDVFTDMQLPILISILYFIFQMPMVNTMLYKNFAFLSIYNIDGNINFYGIFFKSILFGSIFYGLRKIMIFFTNI